MTMTLEELKRSVQSYRRQHPSWIEAIDAAIKERDELRSTHMQDCDELLHVPSQGEWHSMMRRAEAAESELAALKQRVNNAPYVFAGVDDNIYILQQVKALAPSRVRLLVELK